MSGVFFLSRSVLSGVAALALAASASVERAKESEGLLFVSAVSKPPTIFFLLINLLTPPHCVHFGRRWKAVVQQVEKEADNWQLQLRNSRINYPLSHF